LKFDVKMKSSSHIGVITLMFVTFLHVRPITPTGNTKLLLLFSISLSIDFLLLFSIRYFVNIRNVRRNVPGDGIGTHPRHWH
jgi:hypothetical protein